MNKSFFIFISLALIIFMGLINLYYGSSSSKKILTTLEQNIKSNAQSNLKSVTPIVKSLLLQGNTRGARNILETWRSNGIFKGYEIFHEERLIDSHTKNLNKDTKRYLEITIPILYSSSGIEWGKIKYYLSMEYLKIISKDMKYGFNTIFYYTTSLIVFVVLMLFISILFSTQKLTKLFDNYLKDNRQAPSSRLLIIIWGPMIKVLDEMAAQASVWRKKSLDTEKLESKYKIYRQVSHDIRSPLAAISVAMKDVDQLQESTRVILRMSVQRIQDIANNLLSKTNRDHTAAANADIRTPVLLYSSLDEIISEKRLQFRSKADIIIQGKLNLDLSLFSKINDSILKRVLSNLINNAVESLTSDKGTVTIFLKRESNCAVIQIADTGKGIPSDILQKLGKEGASFGKNNSLDAGTGLGLYHSIQTIKKWGGDLKLDSTVGLGTTVTIQLPLCAAPDYFLSEVLLKSNQTVCILDDDHEIHKTWNERLKHCIQKNNIKLVHFYTPREVKDWFLNNKKSNITFLSDYELIGFKETGLDLIKELNISQVSILVTSHYAEDNIQGECEKIGLKILPKMMAADIKISVAATTTAGFYDVIYIEDDNYLRLAWEHDAQSANIKFTAIESPENF